jgi:Protein of unknown function DUF72
LRRRAAVATPDPTSKREPALSGKKSASIDDHVERLPVMADACGPLNVGASDCVADLYDELRAVQKVHEFRLCSHSAYALIRLSGRNAQTWNVPGASSASERFNYDYSDAELGELASRISRVDAPMTHVVFNNNMEDQGQRNATTLMEIFDDLDRRS